MKSWKEVRDFVLDNYIGSEYDEEKDILAIPFVTNEEHSRTQTVIIIHPEKDVVGIFSLIGDINKNDLKDALKDLYEILPIGINMALVCDDDECCQIINQEYISALTEDKLDSIAKNVASCADELEEKYVCEDTF